ncbi:MAG: YidC/Oxa1 family membrane protein insertase [Maribacter sp.]|jgi:YidC/Oxa1 family membrane protein insertase
MKDKNGIIGFVLLGILMLAYFWTDANKRAVLAEDQRIEDSIVQSQIVVTDSIDTMTLDPMQLDPNIVVDGDPLNELEDVRLVVKYGDFAMSSTGDEQDYVLENDLIKFTFTNKGARIKQVQLKDFKKSIWNDEHEKEITDLLLLEDERNRFQYNIPVKGVATPVSSEDLYFKAVEVSGNKIVFRAFAGSNDKYFEQTYSLNEDYKLDYDLGFVGLDETIPSGTTDIELEWVNYLDRIEKSTDYESSLSTIYYKQNDKGYSYCSCRGDDEVEKEKLMDWVAHSNQFFNTSLIADTPFTGMKSDIKEMAKEEEDMKLFTTRLKIPYQGKFGMTIYSGPNEYKRMAAMGNDMQYVIPYGRSILGTINRWIIRPLFSFFSGFVGNMGIVILIVTFLVKMVLYPLTYKMLYSQSKMSALKPKIEELKKKIGDDAQAVQVETMKLYRETGVNPLGGCMPMVIQMPIWIALYRFFPASIEFRQASFLWADDLASYDVFWWIPIQGGIPFYGEHLSLFTILWAITTVIYTFYNSKHMDMSANPAMKYMQYMMPLMFLFFFNSMASALTCYMLFSNLTNIAQTVITKNFIINKEKIAEELSNHKAKPKKEGGFRDRMTKAFEQAQNAQAERQKEDKKKK